jgi:multiple sugar transport system substrate-binding protein
LGRPYGVPSQTTPELLFYRKDLFAEAGLEPPRPPTTLLRVAGHFPRSAAQRALRHRLERGARHGARPHLHDDLRRFRPAGLRSAARIAGGFDTDGADWRGLRPTIDTEAGCDAAEYLMALRRFSPPDILSMSWYERVRPYAAGKSRWPMATPCWRPISSSTRPRRPRPDRLSAASRRTERARRSRPSAAMRSAFRPTCPKNASPPPVEALIAFTSPEAQKLYVQNGSRTAPRYSVGADPEVRRLSPIFEAVDGMSWRDELQFWPRPPMPEISEIIQICGEELHDMLRGIVTPREALTAGPGARGRAENQPRKPREEDMDPNRLKGKNILITGAARGMGAANAEHFAEQGANVCLGDSTSKTAREVAERINAPATARRSPSRWTSPSARTTPPPSRHGRGVRHRSMWALQRRPEQAPVLHGYR